jgi:nucleoside-diphosphate-sugar epimerase
LANRGDDVRILDDFSTGKRENISSLSGQIEVIEGDINDPATLKRAMSGVTYCLHQAAIPSVPRSVADPLNTDRANVGGSVAVFLAARDAGVRRLIVASSSSVYGPTAPVPTPETAPLAPASPYAVSKAAADMYAEVFSDLYGTEIVSLRYFNVFGPKQDPASQYAAVVPLFITRLLEGRAPEIHGDGEQSRDFSYVENVVEANLLACAWPGRLTGAYNIACGVSTTILGLYRAIAELMGVSIPPVHTPARAGDIPRSLADCRKAERTFHYKARISVEEGLSRTVAWYRAK